MMATMSCGQFDPAMVVTTVYRPPKKGDLLWGNQLTRSDKVMFFDGIIYGICHHRYESMGSEKSEHGGRSRDL